MKLTMPLLALVVALLLVASQSLYTVDQRQYAIKFQLGEIVETHAERGPVLQGAAAAEREVLRQAHPAARQSRARPDHDLGEEAAAGRLLRAVADHRRQAVLHQRAGRRGGRAPPAVADRPREPRRGVQQAHRARGDLRRARQDHDDDAAEGRRRREDDRRRDRRRAAAARRAAARRDRAGLRADGIGAPARGQRAALARPGGVREDPRRRRPPARGDPRRGVPGRAEDQGRRRRQGRRRSTRRPTAPIPSSTRSTAASRPTRRRSATRAT